MHVDKVMSYSLFINDSVYLWKFVMTSMYKSFLYHWLGYNQKLFELINGFFHNKSVVEVFVGLTEVSGEYMLFPIHFFILITFMFLYIKRGGHSNDLKLQMLYIKTVMILLFSICIGAICVETVKIYLKFTRPYCIQGLKLNPISQGLITFNMSKCNKSCPSGHAWYVATFMFSIWGILNKPCKVIAVIIILLVGASRVVLGMHFPADILYGYLLAFIVCYIAIKVANKLRVVEGKNYEKIFM